MHIAPLKAPDKGEVGGSSPPRPTIEVLLCRLLAALVLSLPFRALPLRIETLFVAALAAIETSGGPPRILVLEKNEARDVPEEPCDFAEPCCSPRCLA